MPRLQLITLDGKKYDQEVFEILLPTTEGQIGVFKNHAPMVARAAEGVIKVRVNQNDFDEYMEAFACHGGVIEIQDDIVKVLVDEAEHAEDIIEAKEHEALEAAKRLRAEAKDQVSIAHAQALMDRAAIRLNVAKLKRRHRHR